MIEHQRTLLIGWTMLGICYLAKLHEQLIHHIEQSKSDMETFN
ncbi:hypothetical protein PSPO_b1234 [Pseudoalteromonas spongiae UST010723-006]|nr:hypothetical protein PSPO_b1234 [Pseudoalteromonas spongiae UST010723-006]